MKAPGELFYWKKNDNWWTVDEKTGKFILTEAATQEAKASFYKYEEYIKNKKR